MLHQNVRRIFRCDGDTVRLDDLRTVGLFQTHPDAFTAVQDSITDFQIACRSVRFAIGRRLESQHHGRRTGQRGHIRNRHVAVVLRRTEFQDTCGQIRTQHVILRRRRQLRSVPLRKEEPVVIGRHRTATAVGVGHVLDRRAGRIGQLGQVARQIVLLRLGIHAECDGRTVAAPPMFVEIGIEETVGMIRLRRRSEGIFTPLRIAELGGVGRDALNACRVGRIRFETAEYEAREFVFGAGQPPLREVVDQFRPFEQLERRLGVGLLRRVDIPLDDGHVVRHLESVVEMHDRAGQQRRRMHGDVGRELRIVFGLALVERLHRNGIVTVGRQFAEGARQRVGIHALLLHHGTGLFEHGLVAARTAHGFPLDLNGIRRGRSGRLGRLQRAGYESIGTE